MGKAQGIDGQAHRQDDRLNKLVATTGA
jgi:hypothetical protein